MLKYIIMVAVPAFMLCGTSMAQEAEEPRYAPAFDSAERVLIDDPEPVETEYFLAEGAANADVVTEAELHMEAVALAALSDEIEGDMAAMADALEE